MPRALLTPAVGTTNGAKLVNEVDGNTVDGHYLANSGRTRLIARNSGAVARTVTIQLFRTVDGQSVTSKTKAVPAGETWIFGPFPKDDYGTQVFVDVDNAELKLRAIE